MLESFTSGLFIIIIYRNGLSEVILEEAGIVIPPKNSEMLKNSLNNDAEKRSCFGKNGRKKGLNEISLG